MLQNGFCHVLRIEMKNDLLTSVFQRLRPRLFSKARTALSDDEEARDVLQDAFFKLWQSRIDINRESHAEGLLVTTVRNLSIDRLRRRAAHPTDSLDGDTGTLAWDDETEADLRQQNEIYLTVEKLIERHLSPRDREILYLRDRDEWEFEDIAIRFDITEANARLIVARARKTIRTLYNQPKS